MPTGSQGTQAWDRYGFVNNNPVKYVDPTGHDATVTTYTYSSATSFFEYVDSTSNVIGNRKDILVGTLEAGAIIVGGLTAILTANPLVGIGVGIVGWGTAKAAESGMIMILVIWQT